MEIAGLIIPDYTKLLTIMDIEMFRNYCLIKKGCSEETPFGPNTIVFKVMGKMFALMNLDEPLFANLKYDFSQIEELRSRYDAILPGYHMSKKHWNSVYYEKLPNNLVQELVDHSYDLIVRGLPKKMQVELENLDEF